MNGDTATQEKCEAAGTAKRAASNGKSEEGLVCTLFEGEYHFGLAALINSLVRNGYHGSIAVGYRGALPPWLKQLKPLEDDGSYEVSSGVRIDFILLDTPVHFTHFKPQFMLQLIGERRGCKYIYYFDPDIVIACAWSFYAQWVRHGVALCEDVNALMPENHPTRCEWREMVAPLGLRNPVPLRSYYNGGFIGLPTSCSGFLHRWQQIQRLATSRGLDLRDFAKGHRTNPFNKGDQDALNIAAMYTEYPLTTLGQEGMGFGYGEIAMYHAIGAPKPWRKNMLVSAIQGMPPTGADKAFVANLANPIRLYSSLGRARRRTECRLGAALGRFYGRR